LKHPIFVCTYTTTPGLSPLFVYHSHHRFSTMSLKSFTRNPFCSRFLFVTSTSSRSAVYSSLLSYLTNLSHWQKIVLRLLVRITLCGSLFSRENADIYIYIYII
jgi:hypothetical protein